MGMDRRETLLIAACVAFFEVMVVKSAWLAEDAYISFRVVDNWASGYGLTWNPAERVQAYTHPLWLLLIAGLYGLTHEIYYSCVLLSLGISLAVVLLFAFRIAASASAAALGIVVFASSKAFVDYSTSGLENPLTHLLLALFLCVYLEEGWRDRKLFCMSFIAALGALNRMDTILFYLPAIACGLWLRRDVRGLRATAVGFLPFAVWLIFSLFYYGFLFPNTAYAKLNTGVARAELIVQGMYYLKDAMVEDPLTPIAVVAGIASVLLTRAWCALPLAGGILFYLLYVVAIGGDFMSGRFLTGPLFWSVALVATRCSFSPKGAAAVLTVVLLAIFFTPHPPLTSGRDYGAWEDKGSGRGIADERAFYYLEAGLLRGKQDDLLRNSKRPQWGRRWATEAQQRAAAGITDTYVAAADAIGYAGFYAGPRVHILNPLALTDPLLARLPPVKNPQWRIGHFARAIPDGYVKTLQRGENLIADERLAAYYERLALITRGRLLDGERLVEIWSFNTGKYDYLIEGME